MGVLGDGGGFLFRRLTRLAQGAVPVVKGQIVPESQGPTSLLRIAFRFSILKEKHKKQRPELPSVLGHGFETV